MTAQWIMVRRSARPAPMSRRLQTVMERILDDVSYTAPDRSGETVTVDAAFVEAAVGDLARNADLSRFIL